MSQFTGRLFELHDDDRKKANFDDLMARVLGYHLDWRIDLTDGQYGQNYYLKIATGVGVNHTSEGLGDGIISLLFILNALYDSEPQTLVVIDEPELSLHPQLIRRLGEVISEYASDRQIVILTHSPQLVSWDDVSAGAAIARVYKEDDRSLVAQPTRESISEVTRLRRGWRNPHALGLDATSALFLDDRVIVVEGQEDAALIPRAFEQAGVPFNGSVFGWGASGAGNIEKILRLLQGLGFKRVAALLDNNVPDVARALRDEFPDYLVREIPAADIRDKPAETSGAKTGLMDAKGRYIKPELREDAHKVLAEISSHLEAPRTAVSED